MDSDRSYRRPMKFSIDYTTPFEVVDVSGGSAPLTAGSSRGRPTSSESPQAIYSLVDIPISTSKAVRIGCWTTSPIDTDYLKGIIQPNFLHFLESRSDRFDPPPKEWPSPVAVEDVFGHFPSNSSSSSDDVLLPVRISEDTYTLVPMSGKTEVYKGSDEDTVEEPVEDDPTQECPPSVEFPPGSLYCTDQDLTDRTWIVNGLKENLKSYEIMFKSQYCYDTTTMEERCLLTALSPGNNFFWKEKSSGIMWVGVYGLDDICVVTLSEHVDRKRVRGCLASTDPKSVLSIFRQCLLSELEDLADPSSKRSEEVGQSFDTPFFVVSATPGTAKTPEDSGHETSSIGYLEEAIFCVQGTRLLQKVQDRGDAIKLAIFGFQRLMGKKCEAKEIGVSVLFG